MSYIVKMTDTAKQDLRNISIWITEKSGDSETAREFVMALKKECGKLKRHPNIGAIPRDRILSSLGYRFITHEDYVIFYLADADSKMVYVMAIFNSKMDYPHVMKKFI